MFGELTANVAHDWTWAQPGSRAADGASREQLLDAIEDLRRQARS